MKLNFEERPISYSAIKNFQLSPEHLIHYYASPREKTDALIFGSLVDTLILTPNEYEANFIVAPDVDRRTKEGKATYEAFKIQAEGKTIISLDQLLQARAICHKAVNHPIFSSYLEGEKQKVINFLDRETGIHCTTRLDNLNSRFIVDLKTTVLAEPDSFMRSAYNFGYHIQAGMYKKALNSLGINVPYYLLAIEKEAPYGLAVYKAGADFMRKGEAMVNRLLKDIKYCNDMELWDKSYDFRFGDEGVTELNLPAWVR